MKRILVGGAIAIIAIIAFGLTMNEIVKVQKFKDRLIDIGDSYRRYVDGIEEYQNIEDKDSDYANSVLETAYWFGDNSFFLIERLYDEYPEDWINKYTDKISVTQLQNLHDAIAFYIENKKS